MNWKPLADTLGIEGSLTDANAEELIGKAFKDKGTLALSNVATALGSDGLKDVEGIEPAIKDAVSKQVDLKLAEKTERQPDPALVTVTRELGGMKTSRLVEAGIITPKTKADFDALYLADAPLTLSLSQGKGTDMFDSVLKIIEANKPVGLEGVTKGQTLKLARDGEPEMSACEKNAEDRAEVAAKARKAI